MIKKIVLGKGGLSENDLEELIYNRLVKGLITAKESQAYLKEFRVKREKDRQKEIDQEENERSEKDRLETERAEKEAIEEAARKANEKERANKEAA